MKSRKEPYTRVNTREFNGVPKYNVSYLYTLDYWSMLY